MSTNVEYNRLKAAKYFKQLSLFGGINFGLHSSPGLKPRAMFGTPLRGLRLNYHRLFEKMFARLVIFWLKSWICTASIKWKAAERCEVKSF
ncbi:hypothetical protein CWD77_11935 [Rhodohalobacter barkolensis]|uniref:Uncharacterized protein n=1 Tax=Rhodohalobacter barkolensis TaxID=2053187 RepID=A0A2N0VGJ6_9BACT|nr:hypothetical protein CWD77_11935 [Rhodohalobacter barkolensis]